MLLEIGLLWRALIVVLGFLWLREMLGRWRKDWAELRTTRDAATRAAIVALWLLTLLLLFVWIDCVAGAFRFGGL
jgi:hypothetical protein